MIELAWLWLRYQPDSALSIWFRVRVGTMKGPHHHRRHGAQAPGCAPALSRDRPDPHGALLKA
jgi:transposase